MRDNVAQIATECNTVSSVSVTLVYIGTGLGVVVLTLAVVLFIFFRHRSRRRSSRPSCGMMLKIIFAKYKFGYRVEYTRFIHPKGEISDLQ